MSRHKIRNEAENKHKHKQKNAKQWSLLIMT